MQEQTTQDIGAFNNQNVARGTLAQPASPLQSALNNQGEQLDKLAGLISELEGRLAPLRNSVPSQEQEGVPEPTQSVTTNHVIGLTFLVQRLQARVADLLLELEV